MSTRFGDDGRFPGSLDAYRFAVAASGIIGEDPLKLRE
jgi:hypothetical protein